MAIESVMEFQTPIKGLWCQFILCDNINTKHAG